MKKSFVGISFLAIILAIGMYVFNQGDEIQENTFENFDLIGTAEAQWTGPKLLHYNVGGCFTYPAGCTWGDPAGG